jgi:hypothetical protein
MPERRNNGWLAGLFWAVAFVTTLLVLVPTLHDWKHPSGEFGGLVVLFDLIVASFVGITIAVVAIFRRSVAYAIGLVLLAGPGLLFGAGALNTAISEANAPTEAEIRAAEEARAAGHGYFTREPDRALADAIVAGDAARVAALAPAADLHAVGDSQMTFMELALEDGRARRDVVAALLKAGADPDQDHGRLFDLLESEKGKGDGRDAFYLRVAIESGVDPNHADREGRPRFFGAMCWATPETITFLLDHGVNIETEDREGNTVVQWLARWCDADHVDLLLARGAHSDHLNHAGKNLRDIVLAEVESRRQYNTISPALAALEQRFRQ